MEEEAEVEATPHDQGEESETETHILRQTSMSLHDARSAIHTMTSAAQMSIILHHDGEVQDRHHQASNTATSLFLHAVEARDVLTGVVDMMIMTTKTTTGLGVDVAWKTIADHRLDGMMTTSPRTIHHADEETEVAGGTTMTMTMITREMIDATETSAEVETAHREK